MDHRLFLLILSFLICSFLGAALTLLGRRIMQSRQAKLRQRLGGESLDTDPEQLISPEYRNTSDGIVGQIDQRFSRFMAQTGVDLDPDTAFLVAVAVGLLLCGVVLLWRDDMLESAVAMLVGMASVLAYYSWRRSKRRSEIQEQLPDVMDSLARAVRAGQSLDQAIKLVGQTSAKPLGPEFKRCAKQLDMGLSVDSAMRSLSRRAPISEIRILATTFMVQRRSGGSLPTTLERLSHVIRDRINYHRQFKAATGAGRVSTTLIAVAGPLVAAYLIIFQREYFDRFTATSAGQALLASAILLQVVGITWIYSLLKSDY
ncbi:MAG: type II secretion system F family protein [Pirellulaceae bacterium]|nr:type II secretion system F family protein [Planctomycetales bacterium]MCA9204301.1 type II secretion system F family protein [Planctomycetales bacterium]